MKNIFILLSFIPLLGRSQNDSLFTKDGYFIGMKADFMQECMSSATSEHMELGGKKMSFYSYCSCMADNVFLEMEMSELESIQSEADMLRLFTGEKYLPLILECAEEYPMDNSMTFSDKSKYSDIEKQLGYAACLSEIKADPQASALLTTEQAENYCSCAIDKIYEKGYTLEQVMQAEDTNSEVFNEIVMACMMQAMAGNISLDELTFVRTPTTYNPNDIIGSAKKSNIPLISNGAQNFKIKLTFGGKSSYFLLDTGASDLCVSEEYLFQWMDQGLISDDDYLGSTKYELADSRIITVEMYEINEITIGDYVVKNVTVAVAPELSLLCGQSLLNKFKSYKIDPTKSILTLER